MAAMKRILIHEVLLQIEEGDEFRIVFANQARRDAAWNLLRFIYEEKAHFSPNADPREGNKVILMAVIDSGEWCGQNNRTYTIIAGKDWRAPIFSSLFLEHIERVEILSPAEDAGNPTMDADELLETLQLLQPGDSIRVALKPNTGYRTSMLLRRFTTPQVFEMPREAAERIENLRRSSPPNRRIFEANICKVWFTPDFTELFPYIENLEVL